MNPVWTYPPKPTDKGHSYRQLAPTLGIEMWNLHYTRRQRQKPCKQRQWINRCSFADAFAIFSRQCGDCHLSPCTFQSMTKFAAKVLLSLRIFRTGLGEPLSWNSLMDKWVWNQQSSYVTADWEGKRDYLELYRQILQLSTHKQHIYISSMRHTKG
jgi:hypothetical protein